MNEFRYSGVCEFQYSEMNIFLYSGICEFEILYNKKIEIQCIRINKVEQNSMEKFFEYKEVCEYDDFFFCIVNENIENSSLVVFFKFDIVEDENEMVCFGGVLFFIFFLLLLVILLEFDSDFDMED